MNCVRAASAVLVYLVDMYMKGIEALLDECMWLEQELLLIVMCITRHHAAVLGHVLVPRIISQTPVYGIFRVVRLQNTTLGNKP